MSGLFNLPPRATKAGDSLLAKKAAAKIRKKAAGPVMKGGGSLLERISTIVTMVKMKLGQYFDKYELIQDPQVLQEFIDACIVNGEISIDTETTGLDPISDKIAGLCLFTPGRKAVYVPLHHVSYITGVEITAQVPVKFAAAQMQRLADAEIDIIMFNAKFDIRMIFNQLGVKLKVTWDAYVAARLLNENEPENNLKELHRKYCLNGVGDAFTFSALFKGIVFTLIPVKVAFVYAARDAEITYELYQFQKPFLTVDNAKCIEQDLTRVASVFHNIEMPLILVVAEMEDTGVAFDFEVAEKLSKKYTAKLNEKLEVFNNLCMKYEEEILKYRNTKGSTCKLGLPINIASPDQLAILLYDILKQPSVDKNKPRGTGEDILLKMDTDFSRAILDYRAIATILKTFIDKLPTVVNPKTGRIHASFNQMGTVTGRFSSSDPNLQNIPSHNKDIRKMFKATDGYVMISSDYSAQEPRLTAHLSKDQKMIQAYLDGLDVYAVIAAEAFGLPYDECKEYRADGTKSAKGAERRSIAKAIVLGVCYGKGVAAIAEDLKITKRQAQEIYNKIMALFPGLKKFMEDSEQFARKYGYVETFWGRKRRLPDIQLPPYEFSYVAGVSQDFDPLFEDDEEEDFDLATEVSSEIKHKYTSRLNKCYDWKSKAYIIQDALIKDHVKIKDNGGFIAEATRQCVNSRVQGSAADQTKQAMILAGNDVRLKELGFRLLIPVHDELIGECPQKNAKIAASILPALMIEAAKELCIPSKCDVEMTKCWYGESLQID